MTLPGPNGGSLHFGANGAVPNSGPQDPGLHINSQDPGHLFHPQHHVSARPLFYIHPQPPPPFHPYQWPMPFSYNPFAGYPGMGYGMVMPSFPPPNYMDPSAYLLPQPHIQAVDYRRLLHPQVHAPFPNQTRRTRPPYTAQYRETMNSEVQTEPIHTEPGGYARGSLFASSDSGHGTTSNSPSSSSSPIKTVSASVENHNLPSSDTEDIQLNKASKSITVKHGSNIPHPTKTVHSCIRETQTQKSHTDTICQETVPACGSVHCNMWSVSSSDSMVPICSSSQEENEVSKERRVSIPDILSWGGGTPQSKVIKMTDKMLPHCYHQVLSQTELEHERPLYRSPTVTRDAPVMTDSNGTHGHGNDAMAILSSKASETFFKILKLPKISDEQEDGNETDLEEDAPEVSHNEMPFNSYRMGRKMNESVWSVESLPLFAPSKEWLLQNGMLEPDVIVEMTEEIENCDQSTESDNLIVEVGKMKQHCRIPPKVPELDFEMCASEMKGLTQVPCITPENIPCISMTGLQNKKKSPLTAKDVDENGSSEPEANQSPNQEPLIVNGRQERSPCPPALEAVPLLSPTSRKGISFADHLIVQNRVDIEVEDETCGNRLGNEQLCVPVAKPIMTEVSPSKGHLVDCGIQCTELQEPCSCREVMDDMETKRRHPLKYSDVKMANKGQDEGVGGHVQRNQKRHYQRRNRVLEEYARQQEAFSGYYGKSGKSRGGNGRNTRC